MVDMIMVFGSVLFFVCFAMLFFTFLLLIWSFFLNKKEYDHYEPTVSVIIPAYNEEKRIGKCLQSVFDVKYPKEKIEVVVVDDGSTDKTVELVKSYGFKVLKQNHKGKVDALNLGLKKSKSEVIVTIDADTIIEKDFIKKIARPFIDENLGATSGSVLVKNKHSLLGRFQHIEYHVNNLARRNFSKVFNTGIWFFGALAAYRRSALEKVGGFKLDTMAEDWDIVLEIKRSGYGIINVCDAVGYTYAPDDLRTLFKQRVRWWIGGTQALRKNKELIVQRNPSLLYLFIHHFWWAIYAIVSLPVIIYQVNYWMPQGIGQISWYLFRWFTMVGPFYVLYKIPEWGINIYGIFGVLSGVFSVFFTVFALYMFKERLTLKNFLVMFFYFPYTVILNSFVAVGVLKSFSVKTKYYVK